MDENIIANLATELPACLAAADGVVYSSEEEKVSWWATHHDYSLPQWVSCVKKLLIGVQAGGGGGGKGDCSPPSSGKL